MILFDHRDIIRINLVEVDNPLGDDVGLARFQTRRFFHVSLYISLCKTCDPQGRAIFGPKGIIGTNLVEDRYVKLHTKYQGSRPYGIRQEDFFMFFYIKDYVKYVTPGVTT